MSENKTSDISLHVTKDVTVTNKLGIHLRPAAEFVRLATQFKSEVFVEKDGHEVNGKSVMGVLLLAAGPGSKIRVKADGADAARAVHELESLVKRRFGED